MISNHKRLQELRQQAKELEEKIEQLQDQLNNAEPTTGLLGQWATNRHGKRVLITTDRPVDGWIETTYVNPDGTTCERVERFDSLSFPEQTTRPEDVPVGEAWLVDADGIHNSVVALKVGHDAWKVDHNVEPIVAAWSDEYITLITPLIPARPQDTPETVFRREEYATLPVGTIVASEHGAAWQKLDRDEWVSTILPETRFQLPEGNMERTVLRRGWGE